MGPLDAALHLLNLFVPALGLAAVTTVLTKLFWRAELRSVGWLRLMVPAAVVSSLTTVGGLVLLGQDGRTATYGAMVVLCALTLWWRGFGPGR